ncbi:MAG: HAMP domain-containing histidine kinase [Eggerthellaceae bacterium]|nr:HAMP domain-containing histidine kinase [Eggerthellaceae bacterium]
MTLAFALVALMTAAVAFGVLSIVWQQHFHDYTRDNMGRIATNTASQIASLYEDRGEWDGGVLRPAEEATRFSPSVGVQVVATDGTSLFDSTRVDDGPDISLAPRDSESIASAPIMVKGEQLGVVRVWVYGSNTLLTRTDQEFRDKSYQAMVLASVLAVLLAMIIGIPFARGLVNPINRISRAAKSFGEGNLGSRTNMVGDDEISQLGQTFDRMAESVEKDRELEHRLTTDVAHELRTPLMAIQSTVEAMIDGVFEADEERLDTVNSEVQRLSRLVDAILKLSRLENRSTPLKQEVVNVGDLISGLIATHEAYVKDSGLQLVYEADPDVYAYCDKDMIRQAVANLISNAVRYTPEGTITVTVRKSEPNVRIAVADTGIGLSEADAKMVFSRFWRADSGRNRESGGLGVGLAVVKEIVGQHGGSVEVQGEEGVGSTFTIVLPLYVDESQQGWRRNRNGNRAPESSIDEAWDEDWESSAS